MKKWIVIVLVCAGLLYSSGCFKSWQSQRDSKQDLLDSTPVKARNLANLLADMPKTFNTLILLAVGGAIFAMAAKTHIGWVITGASIGGMALMVTFARYAEWIGFGVLALGVMTIIAVAGRYRSVAKYAIAYGQNLKQHLPDEVIKKVNKTAYKLQPTEVRSGIKKIKND